MAKSLFKSMTGAFLIALVCSLANYDAYADPLIFKVGYAAEWAPISYGENEDVKGILPDLIDEIISKRMKIPVIHQGLPWARAQMAVQNGRVDAIITTPTEKRLKYLLKSQSNILRVPFRAFSLKGSMAETKLEQGHAVYELSKFNYCDVLGNGWAKTFYKARDIDYLVTPSLDNCLKMLTRHRVDIIIHASPVTQMFLKKMAIEDKVVMLPKIYPASPNFPLLLSKKSDFGPAFLKRFDETVQAMKDSGEFDRLVKQITERNLNAQKMDQ